MRMSLIGTMVVALLATGCARVPMAPPAPRTGAPMARAAEKLPAASPYRGLAIRAVADDRDPAATPWDKGRSIKYYTIEAANQALVVTLSVKAYGHRHVAVSKADLAFEAEGAEEAFKAYYEGRARSVEYRELALALKAVAGKVEDGGQREIVVAAYESLLNPSR